VEVLDTVTVTIGELSDTGNAFLTWQVDVAKKQAAEKTEQARGHDAEFDPADEPANAHLAVAESTPATDEATEPPAEPTPDIGVSKPAAAPVPRQRAGGATAMVAACVAELEWQAEVLGEPLDSYVSMILQNAGVKTLSDLTPGHLAVVGETMVLRRKGAVVAKLRAVGNAAGALILEGAPPTLPVQLEILEKISQGETGEPVDTAVTRPAGAKKARAAAR
jgi:hypothetical protein